MIRPGDGVDGRGVEALVLSTMMNSKFERRFHEGFVLLVQHLRGLVLMMMERHLIYTNPCCPRPSHWVIWAFCRELTLAPEAVVELILYLRAGNRELS